MTNEPCPTCGHVAEKATLEGFDEFWEAFADKRGIDKAKSVWKSRNLANKLDEILAGAVKYKLVRKRPYCQMPATWLRGGHWSDEIVLSKEHTQTEYAKMVKQYGIIAVTNAVRDIKIKYDLNLSDDMAKIVGMVPDYIEGEK